MSETRLLQLKRILGESPQGISELNDSHAMTHAKRLSKEVFMRKVVQALMLRMRDRNIVPTVLLVMPALQHKVPALQIEEGTEDDYRLIFQQAANTALIEEIIRPFNRNFQKMLHSYRPDQQISQIRRGDTVVALALSLREKQATSGSFMKLRETAVVKGADLLGVITLFNSVPMVSELKQIITAHGEINLPSVDLFSATQEVQSLA